MRSRFLYVFFLSCALPFTGMAQGLLNNGAFIVTSGAAQIYISGATGNYTSQSNGVITPSTGAVVTVEGNWVNNAGNTGFTADAGTVVLNGAAQSISGTSSTTFYNLTLQGTNTKTLNVNTSVGGVSTTTGILSLGTRPLALNSKMLTITNTANTAVTYSIGYVLSETNVSLNPSIMRWNTGAFSATYVYPFGTAAGIQIPLTFNKTVATASNVDIATRPTAASDNVPWASGVTQMYDPTLAQDGSDEAVIDRWWEITASTAITADITFRYLGTENTLIVPYNIGNLGAQYWSAAWLPNNSNIGSAPAVLAGVGAVTAPGLSISNSYTPWVLSSLSAPLPIELTSLNASCNLSNGEVITWTTATELNNNFFDVERCDDGINFYNIGRVNGAGTSSQVHTYSFVDSSPVFGSTYYRLRQTDFNGQNTESKIIAAETCSGENVIDAFSSTSGINILMNLSDAGDYNVGVYDMRGRKIDDENISAAKGANHFLLNGNLPATGIYLVRITGNNGQTFSKKILYGKN